MPWLWLLKLGFEMPNLSVENHPGDRKIHFRRNMVNIPSVVSFKENLTKSYTKLDYCVQYRESSFNFVSRLLESEGIFYFFEHTDR